MSLPIIHVVGLDATDVRHFIDHQRLAQSGFIGGGAAVVRYVPVTDPSHLRGATVDPTRVLFTHSWYANPAAVPIMEMLALYPRPVMT